MSRHVLLIDFASLATPLWMVSGTDPDPDSASTKIVDRVRALTSGQPHAALCFDKPPYFRKTLDASYKANRPQQAAAMYHQFETARRILASDGFPCWEADGFESDDIIASSVALLMAVDDVTVIVCSNDKDLLSLVGPRVSVKSLQSGNVLDEAAVVAKFGVNPSQMTDYLALVGDASDNVKGANKIGPVKAAKLLQTFGNLADLYAAIASGEAKIANGELESLKEFMPRSDDVRALIALRTDVPLPIAEVLKPREIPEVAMTDDIDEAMPTLPSTAGSSPAPVAGAGEARSVSASSPDQAQPALRQQQDENDRFIQKALTVRQPDAVLPAPVSWERELEPRTYGEVRQMADDLFKSRLFSAYGHPAGVMATIIAGRELGLQTAAALRAIHVIDGKQSLAADLIRALVLRSGMAEYFRCTERTAERATFVTKRKGDPELALSYTIAEGRTAWQKSEDAWLKSGWTKNPADMLVARAGAKLARLVYPDVTHGLYAPEELEG
jgi:5'-3' exonuclease